MNYQVNNNLVTIILIFIVAAILYSLTSKSRRQIAEKKSLLGIKLTYYYFIFVSFVQLSQAVVFYKIATDVVAQKKYPVHYARYVKNPIAFTRQAYIYVGVFIILFVVGMFIRRQKEWARKMGIAVQYISILTMVLNIVINRGLTLL